MVACGVAMVYDVVMVCDGAMAVVCGGCMMYVPVVISCMVCTVLWWRYGITLCIVYAVWLWCVVYNTVEMVYSVVVVVVVWWCVVVL